MRIKNELIHLYRKIFRRGLLEAMKESIINAKEKPSRFEVSMMYALGWTLDEVRNTNEGLLKRGYIKEVK